MHNIGFKAEQRWYIRSWCVSKTVVSLTLTMFILSHILKQYVDEGWSKLKSAEGIV